MVSLPSSPSHQRSALLALLAERAYRLGDFTLASGRRSEHYVNCKPVSLSGFGLALLGRLMLEQVEAEARAVAGLTLGADPLVSAVALKAALAGRDPDALIVGGGAIEADEAFRSWFIQEIRAGMPNQREEQAELPIRVIPGGDTAGARGAALDAARLVRERGL